MTPRSYTDYTDPETAASMLKCRGLPDGTKAEVIYSRVLRLGIYSVWFCDLAITNYV